MSMKISMRYLLIFIVSLMLFGCNDGSLSQSTTNSKASIDNNIGSSQGSKQSGAFTKITITSKEKITGLYVAYFNRASDQEGLEFWNNKATTALNSGDDASVVLKELSASFAKHPTFTSTYKDMGNQEFVEAIYQNSLGKNGDAEGIAHWTKYLDGGKSRSDMVSEFIEASLSVELSSENFPNLTAEELAIGQERQDLISNKVEVALSFTNLLGEHTNVANASAPENDIAYKASIKILANIDDDSSVADALAFLKHIQNDKNPIERVYGMEVIENLQKNYLIDSPLQGVSYFCDGIEGLTDADGMFMCQNTPVIFKIGNLTLGTLTSFTLDRKVYPQDILGLARTNFSDSTLKLLARFLQSLDDGDIENRITITKEVREQITEVQDFKGMSESEVKALLQGIGKDFVPECGALKHLGDTSVECESDGSYHVVSSSGGGGSSSGGTSTTKTSVKGTSYKGIISDAVIEIYDFSNNTKGNLLKSGTITDSQFNIEKVDSKKTILIEIKKNADNTAYYIDESNGNKVLFNNLVLKSIIDNPTGTEDYVVTPLTTFATELVLSGSSNSIEEAYQTISKLFGLSFNDLNKVKPNVEGLKSASIQSKENEYATVLLSLVAYLNEINSVLENDITIVDLMNLILKDLSDGIFDGKNNGTDITITDGTKILKIGDIPTKLSRAGAKSLSGKNGQLFDNMRGYFLRLTTASRTIEPPKVEITANKNMRMNEKTIFSAKGSSSPFGYPLTFSWSITNYPTDATASFVPADSVNSFLTVDKEGEYTIHLEVSDGQNRVVKEMNVTADLDGDGLLSSEDLDIDGDGILNTDDKFPNDPAEFLDSNDDDTGNFAQSDEDDDGVDDTTDDYPFDNSKSQITTFNESEFNGNLNDGNTLSGQIPYRISGVINANGSDDDYFKFSSTTNSIVSVSLTKTYKEFEPIVSVVDSNGNPLPSINNISDADTTILTFRIPMDGTFALIVTDKNSQPNVKNTYIANIFIDSDMDGVSDDYEIAIGSNKNSSDTDADGIKDYYEIYTNSFDIDGDGVPNWLDNDSDGDDIPDSKETLTDYDNDGLLNPYDTDSDGNGILDSVEVGSNPLEAVDTDNDGFADYMDIDDDNDGILDIKDNDRLVIADTDNDMSITLKGIINSEKISNSAQSAGVLEIKGDNFASNSSVILIYANGVYNLTPTEINATDIKVTLAKIEGKAEIKIYSNSKLSQGSIVDIVATDKPIIFEVAYPNGQTYALENDTVTLTGINLSSVNAIKLNGTNVNLTSSSPTSVTFDVTSDMSSGVIIASTLNGDSNLLSVFIGREITGKVELPQGSSYSFSDLKIEYAGIESTIQNDGSFSLIAKNKKASSITIFTPEDGSGNISMYLSALVLENEDSNIVVNAKSTAIDIMFSAFNGESADAPKQRQMYDTIKDNIDIFANHLNQNIGNDPYYISKATDEYINALSESKTIIYKKLQQQLLIQKINVNKLSKKFYKIKVNEVSGFSVYKTGDPIDGKIEIQNDTMLFADYQIKNLQNGKITKAYTNQFYSPELLGPQYTGFFLYLSSDVVKNVSFESSQVVIVTPKFKGMTFSNFKQRPEYKLAIRTLVSQGFIPIISEIIPFPGNDVEQTLTKILFINALNGPSIDYFSNGEIKKGFGEYIKSIKDSLKDAIIKKALQEAFHGAFSDKNIAKLITKLVGFAVPTKAVSVVGTAVDVGWMVIDFNTVDDKIAINVNFPIEIQKIYPTSIRKDATKRIYIEGKGLDKYCLNYDLKFVNGYTSLPENVCVSWQYPKVLLTNNDGDFEEVNLIKLSGNKYNFYIPRDLIKSDTTNIKVQVKHIHKDEQDIDEDVDITVNAPEDITIVDELTISNLTPDSGGVNTRVTINGTGFSTDQFENYVYFTTSSGYTRATAVTASESQLEVYVPQGAITGDVWVMVDTEQSNKLPFTISTKQLQIKFGDNGGINDDTFALEFNGKVIKTMNRPSRAVYGNVELVAGEIYTAKLKGITAPDNIGTYYIQFPSEIEVISGDSLSGSDLVAHTVKSWQVRLEVSSTSSPTSNKMTKHLFNKVNHSSNESSKELPLNQSIKSNFAERIQLQPEVRQ